MKRITGLAVLLVIVLLALACGASATPQTDFSEEFPRKDFIDRIKNFEKSLGFEPTKNFLKYSPNIDAYHICYYTGIFDLPPSYVGLDISQGTKDGCSLNEEKYDVFFYPMEARAGIGTPLTKSLAEAPMERFLMIVFHEDFHEQISLPWSNSALEEGVTTLIGLAAARDFAKEEFGKASPVYQNLSVDLELFMAASSIVNFYAPQFKQLYDDFSLGGVSHEDTQAKKRELFRQMLNECKLLPDASSLELCARIDNNARLAFSLTYMAYYPIVYEIFQAHEEDLPAMIKEAIQIYN